MKLLISGILGHMGKEVYNIAKDDEDISEICGVDINAKNCNIENINVYEKFSDVNQKVDMIIDFSNHMLTKDLIEYATKNNISTVIATTGQTAEEKTIINEASKTIPIFFAANYSIGVNLLIDLAKKSAEVMKDAEIEIIETHHNRKLDAPSGTALAIANGIKEVRKDATYNIGRAGEKKRDKNEIGINSIRIGDIVGIHEVLVGTKYQTITLKHEAYDRAVFAEGAILAAKFLINKNAKLYNMNDLLK